MGWTSWLILAIIATPLLILARDLLNRRNQPRLVWLAVGVLGAVLLNIALTIGLHR